MEANMERLYHLDCVSSLTHEVVCFERDNKQIAILFENGEEKASIELSFVEDDSQLIETLLRAVFTGELLEIYLHSIKEVKNESTRFSH